MNGPRSSSSAIYGEATVEMIEKGDRVLRETCRVRQKGLVKLGAWLDLVAELNWAVACAEPDGEEGFNVAARNSRTEWAKEGVFEGEPTLAEIRRHLRATRPADLLIDQPNLVVWRPSGRDRPASPAASLSAREAEVFQWLREGKASDEIALILALSRRTVEKHLQNLYRKLGVSNAQQAIMCSIE